MEKIHRIHFEDIDSTANWIRNHWHELDQNKITCVTATTQSSGRGRQARKWESKAGNLHMSLFYRLKKDDSILANLAQIMALAFCEVFPAQIKWPNDLIVNGAKLGGILVELIDCNDFIGVVHSIGLNVHTAIETDQPTTTLQKWTDQTFDLDSLALTLTYALIEQLKKGFSSETFNSKLAYLGEKMTCRKDNETILGIVRGVDAAGRLMLEIENKEVIYLSSGDLQADSELI